MEERELKKILKQLSQIKGRHTELISVYVPAGFNLVEIGNLISQEISLTQNVKSKTVRKNVISALTKIQQHLKLYKKTPENGLAIFCGNISEKEGVSDVQLWIIEPSEPIEIKLYWCDQRFELEPLEELVKEREIFGLIVMDNGGATLGSLVGKKIRVLRRLNSLVPGKTTKGGWSQMRYQRIREEATHEFYKKIAENVKKEFSKDLQGIILGGPGPAKNDFFDGDFLPNDVKKKILGIKNIGYTDEHGLEELVTRSNDLLAEAAVAKEKELVKKFFEELQKKTGLAVYGKENVLKALERGAVDIILISENVDEKVIGKLESIAENYGTKIEMISNDTAEGKQFDQFKIAGILRYKI